VGQKSGQSYTIKICKKALEIGKLQIFVTALKVKQSCYRPGVAQRVPGS
jgi:hypothetical protein